MTKEELASYRYLPELIRKAENKLKRYEKMQNSKDHGVVNGSSKEFPYIKKSFVVSGQETGTKDKSIDIRELKWKIANNKRELEELEIRVDDYIENIREYQTKLIFEYYFKDRLKEKEIGKRMYLTESAVSKVINRYIQKNQLSSNSS